LFAGVSNDPLSPFLLGVALSDSAFRLVAEPPPPEVPFAGVSNDHLSPREGRAGHLKTLSFANQNLGTITSL
jgi:hypothetical protein